MIEIGNIVKHGKGSGSGVGKNVSGLAEAVTGEVIKDEQLLANMLAAYFASDVSEASWKGERTTADGELIVDGVAVVERLKGLTIKDGENLQSSAPKSIVSRKDGEEIDRLNFDLSTILDENGNQLFPDGELHSAGDVYDEVDLKNRLAIKRMVTIVLDGSQAIQMYNWRPAENSYAVIFARSAMPVCKHAKGNNSLPNMIASPINANTYYNLFNYQEGVGEVTNANDYGLALRLNGKSITSRAELNAYLAEHPIEVYYELETPIIVHLDSAQNWYEVENNGIEEAVVDGSVPLVAEIGYRSVAASDVIEEIENALNS